VLFTAVAADTLPAARKKPTSIKAKNPFFIIVTSVNLAKCQPTKVSTYYWRQKLTLV